MMNEPRSRGPRGGDANTRGDILRAARQVFAEQGYAAASLRSIARAAQVDAALLHHYFGSKVELYWESVMAPMVAGGRPYPNPAEVLAKIVEGPRADLGRRWVLTFLRIWDAPGGSAHFKALLHGLTSGDDALRMIREFLLQEVFSPITSALDMDHPELRAQLAGSQIIGLGVARYVGQLPTLSGVPAEAVAEAVGPALQHYFDDPLPPELLSATDAQA